MQNRIMYAIVSKTLTPFVAWENPLHLHLLLLNHFIRIYISDGIKAHVVLAAEL